jgi:hypothetical protein
MPFVHGLAESFFPIFEIIPSVIWDITDTVDDVSGALPLIKATAAAADKTNAARAKYLEQLQREKKKQEFINLLRDKFKIEYVEPPGEGCLCAS